jgi:hypothetical protein
MDVTISHNIHKFVEFEEPRKVLHLEFTAIWGNKKNFGVSKKRRNLFLSDGIFEVMVTVAEIIGMLWANISIERRSDHDFRRNFRVFCQEGCGLAAP